MGWTYFNITPTRTFNLQAPVPWAMRGHVSASVTPGLTACTRYGVAVEVRGSNGSVTVQGSGSATNYAVPTYISTQTYSEILVYNVNASLSDGVNGETAAYQYDALKRLISATATPNTGSSPTAWTEAYGYDGFGNLTSKSLNGAPGAIDVDPTNNKLQVASIRYDANGNLLAGPGGLAMTYDERNRLASAQPGGTGNPLEYYGYAPDNKRVLRVKSNGTEEWTLYGARGEKLGVYVLSGPNATYDYTGNWAGQSASFVATSTNIWFDGRLVAEGVTWSLPGGNPVFQDRLGTNRASGARFRPYGDEISATANDRVKFGTYTRDGFTGLDYADQRYYASTYGRFNTADPYRASAGAGDPGSWNRYSYVGGDPVNYNDPGGFAKCRVVGVSNFFSDDVYALVSVAEIQCFSDGGTQFGTVYQSFGGDYAQAAGQAESGFGATMDFIEWGITESALKSAAGFIKGMTFGKECLDDLYSVMNKHSDNPTAVELRAAAGAVTFKNGLTTSDSNPAGGTVSGVFTGNPNQYALALLPGGTIYWRPGAETGWSGADFRGGVMHELLHNMGFSDMDLQRGMGLDKLPGYDQNITHDITLRLSADCFGGKR